MKWILIWFVTTANGGCGGGSAEFNSYDACDKAVEMVETATNDWTRESIAFCVAKGRE